MQSVPRAPGQQPPVKIYNAVYSSVQVYECMVRGIAVMRRRADSYVNATQILKVAGVDKGRRTKILEKEILPGKHEIVQGGYGKYQGTWIPLERGRDIALQYGVAPLLAPLFDFTPSGGMNSLTTGNSGIGSPRPLSASASFSGLGTSSNYSASGLAPPPIMPGSALRLLNQGRAQGLFTPSTSLPAPVGPGGHVSPRPYYSGAGYTPSPFSGISTPPPNPPLKRTRSDEAESSTSGRSQFSSFQTQVSLDPTLEIRPADASRASSIAPQVNGDDGPSPNKRVRKEPSLSDSQQIVWQLSQGDQDNATGLSRQEVEVYTTRSASKPTLPRGVDPTAPLKDSRRAAVINAICQIDDPSAVLSLLRGIIPDNTQAFPPPGESSSSLFDVDIVLDDQGHTALHLAASMARLQTVDALIGAGADVHRGNYLGETPLTRACLSTHNSDAQTFHTLVASLHPSIRTLDTSRKSVLHHIMAVAGVKGRAVVARYYLDQIFFWIAQKQGGDFKSIIDLQDEHGDTALNVAARVGNRSLVRTLLDVGANRILQNKLGLRPGDFGVESEELGGGARAEDLISSLRSGPPAPVQKSQDVIADMTAMIQNLASEFSAEIKVKQDSLDVTQAHLRAATRELSEQRKQIQAWQARCGELDQVTQRIRNLEKALAEEDRFDWTGRTDLGGTDARETAGPAFAWRGLNSTMLGLGGTVDVSFAVDPEPPLPTGDSLPSLVRLRRLRMWHIRMEELVKARLGSLRGASAEKEYMCKKIVALCTGIPVDRVEEMLENLVVAVESEAQIVDIGRVSGFMQKVRDGVI